MLHTAPWVSLLQLLVAIGTCKWCTADLSQHLEPFDLRDVKLTGDTAQVASSALNTQYLLETLDADRLLWNFWTNAGLPTKGMPYIYSWEDPNCELRGHFTGHYLTALSYVWRATGNLDAQKRLVYMIDELVKVQDKLGGGYLSAFPEEFWDRLQSFRAVWAPYYTIHKIMAGLLDAYNLVGIEQGLTAVKGMAAYFLRRIDNTIAVNGTSHWITMLDVEFGGMNDVMYNLYRVTKDPEHLRMAHLFDKPRFYDPLVKGWDPLPELHANTHLAQVVGFVSRYEVTKDADSRKAVFNFFQTLTGSHSYVTYGSNYNEHWYQASRLGDAIMSPDNSSYTEETCTQYNLLKIVRGMFQWTGDLRLADFYEHAILNGILGVSRVPYSQQPKPHGRSKLTHSGSIISVAEILTEGSTTQSAAGAQEAQMDSALPQNEEHVLDDVDNRRRVLLSSEKAKHELDDEHEDEQEHEYEYEREQQVELRQHGQRKREHEHELGRKHEHEHEHEHHHDKQHHHSRVHNEQQQQHAMHGMPYGQPEKMSQHHGKHHGEMEHDGYGKHHGDREHEDDRAFDEVQHHQHRDKDSSQKQHHHDQSESNGQQGSGIPAQQSRHGHNGCNNHNLPAQQSVSQHELQQDAPWLPPQDLAVVHGNLRHMHHIHRDHDHMHHMHHDHDDMHHQHFHMHHMHHHKHDHNSFFHLGTAELRRLHDIDAMHPFHQHQRQLVGEAAAEEDDGGVPEEQVVPPHQRVQRPYYTDFIGFNEPDAAKGMIDDSGPGRYLYMLPLGIGQSKGDGGHHWGFPRHSFWCCYGTAVESFAKLHDSIWFRNTATTPNQLLLTQLTSSVLTWKEQHLEVALVSNMHGPGLTAHAILTFKLLDGQDSVNLAVSLRVPTWMKSTGHIKLNGQDYTGCPGGFTPGSFCTITRSWKTGDTVTLDLPYKLWFAKLNDKRLEYQVLKGLMMGPFVMAGLTHQDYLLDLDESQLETRVLDPPTAKLITFKAGWNESLVVRHDGGLLYNSVVKDGSDASDAVFQVYHGCPDDGSSSSQGGKRMAQKEQMRGGQLVMLEALNAPGHFIGYIADKLVLGIVNGHPKDPEFCQQVSFTLETVSGGVNNAVRFRRLNGKSRATYISAYLLPPSPDRQDGTDSCINQHEKCDYWASRNECDKNPSFMLKSCRVSCGLCPMTSVALGLYEEAREDKDVWAATSQFIAAPALVDVPLGSKILAANNRQYLIAPLGNIIEERYTVYFNVSSPKPAVTDSLVA